MVVENVNGDGEIDRIDISAQGWKSWAPMQRNWGETWKFDVPSPFSISFTNRSSRSVVAYNLIPWN